ncbi:PLP-dependent aminotransferase family protein [Thermobacillus sp.]|uniref:MocR-like pyridoxine biosynthesis transcription factor PdxR n=1 Tax=Thermobacillus sp. TaxID=2108467 RepID=UPI00257A0537|nr:PLP-dependent aminotransferase family protein [Thermobacillus sp.]
MIAEGYLVGRIGSGTFVAEGITPGIGLRAAGTREASGRTEAAAPSGQDAPRAGDGASGLIRFDTGVPDLERFPRRRWARYLKEAAEEAEGRYDYRDVRGEEGLRREIAAFLHRSRGMRCEPDRIMIVSGSSEGFALAARTLKPQFDSVCLEDPTIEITGHIFLQSGYRIEPVPVDESGMRVHEIGTLPPGRLLVLTPSHQYPTGSILPIQRRLHAVQLAEEADAYIVEDDYDGDFRLKGVPIPPLYTLGPERVIYAGTFSKTLAPGLRLGFLVLPRSLAGKFAAFKEAANLRTPAVLQAALARFIRDGHLERHIYRMRAVYRTRRALLIEALNRHFGGRAVIRGDEAGMHLLVEFPDLDAAPEWSRSAEYGVVVDCVEDYCLQRGFRTRQIVLGYGNIREEDIEPGIERLSRFVRERGYGDGQPCRPVVRWPWET